MSENELLTAILVELQRVNINLDAIASRLSDTPRVQHAEFVVTALNQLLINTTR